MRRVLRWLAFGWTSISVITLLVLSTLILLQSRFPLNVGVIRTNGRVGLLVTLVPAAVAVGAMLRSSRRTGSLFLIGYSLFWAAIFLSGLPAVWNARRSFCLNALNFCIVSPWVARATVMMIALPFFLAATSFSFDAARQRG